MYTKSFSTYKKLEKKTIYMVKINKLRKFVDAWNTSVNLNTAKKDILQDKMYTPF